MARAKATKEDAGADPNKLARKQAGTYRTADDRFEVRQAALGWFLMDSTATDELGQALVRGPFPTLEAVREALPDARRTTLKPLPRLKPAAARRAKARERPKPAPAPTSWIDRLPEADAKAARRLIRALELEGIADADELAREARKVRGPLVAQRVLEARLQKLLDELPAGERKAAGHVIQRVTELLTSSGSSTFDPLPGWALVEIGPEPEPPNRRIVLRPPARRGSR